MAMTVTPLSPVLGAEITGIDLAGAPGANVVGEIRQTWLDAGGLLVIRDQKLDTEQHIRFSRHFGPLFGAPGEDPLQETVSRYIHPDHPEIYRVSNKDDAKGVPLGRKRAGNYWHSDVSFRERPAAASILNAIEIPGVGGDTQFANTTAAYEALSGPMKSMLAPLRAVHDFAQTAATQFAKPVVVEKDLEGGNRHSHPVVRTHPETGRKSLFVNPGMTTHLDGFDADESRAILEFLYAHMTRPEFVYRHRWHRGDVMIWDNRSLMHYAIADYGDEPRYMERTTVVGDVPV
jgi:taurine dioxygenase